MLKNRTTATKEISQSFLNNFGQLPENPHILTLGRSLKIDTQAAFLGNGFLIDSYHQKNILLSLRFLL